MLTANKESTQEVLPMNRKILLSAAIIVIVLVGLVAVISYTGSGGNGKEQKPFYVGVTYGGDNVQGAKTLIDKVANYTNLFILQSGQLKNDADAVQEVGDYAVAKGLHFAAYFDTITSPEVATWVGTAEQRWGEMFAGVYLGDEPGGKMLETTYVYTPISDGKVVAVLSKNRDGSIYYSESGSEEDNEWSIFSATSYLDGRIIAEKRTIINSEITSSNSISSTLTYSNTTTYRTNGLITIQERVTNFTYIDKNSSPEVLIDNFYTMENGSERIAQVETYQQINGKNPMRDFNSAGSFFENKTREPIENIKRYWNLSEVAFPFFTADYAIHWWDYQSGYDMVLAELGWNNTVAQEIGLVRGAANLQGKSWGTILTWKYMQAPYLTDGAEMFEQMKTSYEAGAEYVIVFNYAKDMSGPYGTLQDEHFQALERFWNEVVQNPDVACGSIKAEAALVLPENYGWGMRNPDDTIWGMWNPNSTSTQIWTQLEQRLDQYGLKLDIVYDDPAYPAAGKYCSIYHWDIPNP